MCLRLTRVSELEHVTEVSVRFDSLLVEVTELTRRGLRVRGKALAFQW
jgi:hypothetical protein